MLYTAIVSIHLLNFSYKFILHRFIHIIQFSPGHDTIFCYQLLARFLLFSIRIFAFLSLSYWKDSFPYHEKYVWRHNEKNADKDEVVSLWNNVCLNCECTSIYGENIQWQNIMCAEISVGWMYRTFYRWILFRLFLYLHVYTIFQVTHVINCTICRLLVFYIVRLNT